MQSAASTGSSTYTGESLPFFDESKVPIQTVVLMHADVKDLRSDECEIIGEKVTYRLAQRPGSFAELTPRLWKQDLLIARCAPTYTSFNTKQ